MHLSKIFIPFQKPKDIYKIHQELLKSLNSQQQRYLYRVEQYKAGYGAEILMQSITEPQTTASAKILATRDYTFTLTENQQLRFLLVANPVKTIRDENGRKHLDKDGNIRLNKKTGKQVIKPCRVPLLDELEQMHWLKNKEIKIGEAENDKIKLHDVVYINELIVNPSIPLYFHKKETGGGKIVPVTFEGVLTVQKPNELQKIIKQGIGSAKAFGCGLLSIAKI